MASSTSVARHAISLLKGSSTMRPDCPIHDATALPYPATEAIAAGGGVFGDRAPC
ncbi:MAG: hypothetical protein HN904_29060 [Victivallales bacterium]|nr:hypothetical protein [Victivallales bacterium]